MKERVKQETLRLSLQSELDSKKTSLERNKLGQFATPTLLAREVVSFGLGLLPKKEKIRFLDPAIGTGSFYSALLDACTKSSIACAKGYEIDPHYGGPAKSLWSATSLDIVLDDFTKQTPPENGFNFLVCNPPYVRHHHLGVTNKKILREKSYAATGIELSNLAGLYCHFLLIAHQWMAPEGVAGWLIPSEFMDVNYGAEVKRYLLEKVTLLRIHRYDPSNVQFDDALVSSAVVWIKNAPPPKNHTVEFTFGGTHDAPSTKKLINLKTLQSESKWSRFPNHEARATTTDPVLSDLFNIRRGIATGDNAFFILEKEKIKALGLPTKFFKPILPSPRYIASDLIEADKDGNPRLDKALFLLDCDLPEKEIREAYPKLWAYLETGLEETATRYICKSRYLWYKQENRPSPLFVCTYMGRSSSASENPFRFLLNKSKAVVANTYLSLYPKPELKAYLDKHPDVALEIWNRLNKISPASLVGEGRVYGGGLHKMEPRELANVPMRDIADLLR